MKETVKVETQMAEVARLTARWMAAQDVLEGAKQDLTRAECELANATTALAKAILPPETKWDEKFTVLTPVGWVTAYRVQHGQFHVERRRGE